MDDQVSNNQNEAPQPETEKAENPLPPQIDLNRLPPLLTIRETAEILRVSPLTLKRWGKRGRLVPIRINSRGDRRYKREAILWLLGINPK